MRPNLSGGEFARCEFVRVAPNPFLTGLRGANEWMRDYLVVFSGVLVLR